MFDLLTNVEAVGFGLELGLEPRISYETLVVRVSYGGGWPRQFEVRNSNRGL